MRLFLLCPNLYCQPLLLSVELPPYLHSWELTLQHGSFKESKPSTWKFLESTKMQFRAYWDECWLCETEATILRRVMWWRNKIGFQVSIQINKLLQFKFGTYLRSSVVTPRHNGPSSGGAGQLTTTGIEQRVIRIANQNRSSTRQAREPDTCFTAEAPLLVRIFYLGLPTVLPTPCLYVRASSAFSRVDKNSRFPAPKTST